MKFSRMADVVAPISEQAKILQGEAVAVIDESTLDIPTQGGFKVIEKWATEWEFHFSDQNNEIHKISSSETMDKSFFTQESYERIVQSIVFDINPPKH